MTKILAFTGSPRKNGNSKIMLNHFLKGAEADIAKVEIIDPYKININHCLGCLKCNIIKKCVQKNDEWNILSAKILAADVIVFASPVYFHHFPAPIKTILDRFRSFVKITMTENGLIHSPWQQWNKKFVLLLSMGTVEDSDAQPIIDLFDFLKDMLGENNSVYTIKAKRIAIANQILFDEEKLKILYSKLKLPQKLIEKDYQNNQFVLNKCFNLGQKLSQ